MNERTARRVTREQLFAQVWSTPTTRLARDYGISDVGLAKICKRMEIPRPPRGYWRKLEVGRKQAKPRLRALSDEGEAVVTIEPTPESHKLTAVEEKPERINVPAVLTDPHPLVMKTQVALEKGQPDERGILIPKNKIRLDVRLSRDSIERGCRVMNALMKTMAARGFTVRVDTEEGNPPEK